MVRKEYKVSLINSNFYLNYPRKLDLSFLSGLHGMKCSLHIPAHFHFYIRWSWKGLHIIPTSCLSNKKWFHSQNFTVSILKLQCSDIWIFIIFYVVLHCVLQIQLETSYQTCQRKEVRPRSLRSCVPLTWCQIERTFIKDGNGNPRIPGMLEKVTCQSMMTGAVGKVERRGQTKGNLVMVKENLCKGLNLLKVIFGVQHTADVKQVSYSHEKIFRQNFKWI